MNELEILLAVRKQSEETNGGGFLCCLISSECGLRQRGQYRGPVALKLRAEVCEFLDDFGELDEDSTNPSELGAYLGINNRQSPILKQYRLAILDAMIARRV